MIDGSGVQRPAQRPVHHIVALRAVLAAHVLDHADVIAALHRLVRHIGVVDQRRQVRAVFIRDAIGRAIRGARQQDGGPGAHPAE